MSSDECEDLIRRADDANHDPEGIALAERAMRQADLSGTFEQRLEARMILTGHATFGGAPEIALVAFTWCLSHFDEPDARAWRSSILWNYKWILRSLYRFPQFTIQQCEQAHEDAMRRFQEAGYSTRPVLLIRAIELSRRGEIQASREVLDASLALPRDSRADCEACEPEQIATVLEAAGDWQDVLRASDDVLHRGLVCAEQPELTHAMVLHSLCEIGLLDEARRYHLISFEPTLSMPSLTTAVARHVLFLLRTENPERAAKAVSAYWGKTLEEAPDDRFDFAVGASLLCRELQAAGLEAEIRIPRAHELHGTISSRDLAALGAYFDAESVRLAAAFDARNGSEHYSGMMARHAEDVAQRTPIKL